MSYLLQYFFSYLIFLVAIFVFICIVMWKIFEKAGEDGWKSLIPIYNIIVYFKIIGLQWWFIFIVLSPVICIITGIWGFISIANLAALGTIIYSSIKLGQCFGRDSSFIVGLCLLSIVFMAIIAFSKDINYLGNNNN